MATQLVVKRPIRRTPLTRRALRKPARRGGVAPKLQGKRHAVSEGSAVAGLPQIDATELRANLSRVVSRVGHGHERIAVVRNGSVDVVMVPREDFERFVWLEDYLDGIEGLKALAAFKRSGKKSIPSSEVLELLGIK